MADTPAPLSSLDAVDLSGVHFMPLRHPTTDQVLQMPDGRPMGFSLVGQDSEQYQAAQRAFRGRVNKSRSGRASPDDLEALAVDVAANCTTDWVLADNNGEVKFSPAAARKLFADPKRRWIREQVDAAIHERANFLGESSRA